MESLSIVAKGLGSVAERIGRGRFRVRIGKSPTADTQKSKDLSEQVQAGTAPASPSDSTQDERASGSYTLRVKPDRRQVRVAIAPDADRRHSC
jgi:hypothetical protein